MGKIRRNRALSLMIAIFAIITNVLIPTVFSQTQGPLQALSGLKICHAMPSMQTASDMVRLSGAEQNESPRDGVMKSHACCKVCVCHPAAFALPTAAYIATFAPPADDTARGPGDVLATLCIRHTKSSPRGPPALV
ncbi:MAG: DUF2946 family protein [Sphingomonadaceae bacterium]